jgi:putative ABC transport system permease protein
MPKLARASWNHLWRHPWQLAPALAGIAIGVAVMLATDLAVDSSRRAFLLSMDAVNGEATHQVIGGPNGVDENLYAVLRVDEGFDNLAPVVEEYVDVGDVTLQLLGVDPLADAGFRDYTAPESVLNGFELLQRLLTDPGAVLLAERTAAALGLAPGDTFTVRMNGREVQARLAGFAGGEAERRLDNLLIADVATAQEWLGRQGQLTRIDVRLPPDDEGAAARLAAELPPGVQLLEAAGRTESVSDMSAAFETNLKAMSLLALLVGVFLIYNSISFAVVQRRGIFGALRALGVTRRELLALVLGEALLLGILGAAAGVALGLWLAEWLLALVSRSINDLYFVVTVTEVAPDRLAIAKGVAAGLAATLVAAAVPAWEAASTLPRLALARAALERRTGRLLPVLALAGLASAVLAAVLVEISGGNLMAGLIALFMLVPGLALCIPLFVRSIARGTAPLAAALGGVAGRLAISGIAASLSRTAVAIVALGVAVSATLGVSVMVDSFRASVAEWLQGTLRSDIYVGVDRGTLQPELVADLVQVPGVAAYSTSRSIWLETESGRVRLTVLELPPESTSGIQLRDGEPAAVREAFREQGAVLVSDSYTYRHGIGRGDTVTLPTAQGERTFPVAATYRSYDADLDSMLMSRHTYDVFWEDARIGSLGLHLAPDTDADAVIERLREAGAGRQALLIRSNREIRELSMEIFDRTFVITDVLYWLALAVALIGIAAAMLALQLERARELAVFRALGMTPRQLGGMVVLQTGFIGLLGGLAAIPLGLLMSWVLIEVINRRAFGWQMDVAVEPDALVAAVALAVGAALLAAIYPARRAARANPALAMRED